MITEELTVYEESLTDSIIAVELEDRGHTLEDAKNVLVSIFLLEPQDADVAIAQYLYTDAT